MAVVHSEPIFSIFSFHWVAMVGGIQGDAKIFIIRRYSVDTIPVPSHGAGSAFFIFDGRLIISGKAKPKAEFNAVESKRLYDQNMADFLS